MVCKNCGADLKPGIKYCLECGNYIDDEDEMFDVSDSSNEMNGYGGYQLRSVSSKKKRRTRIRFIDILIYAGLALIILVSLIVIIITIVRGQNPPTTPPTPTVVNSDSTVNIDNYQIIIPGSLNYDVQGSTLTVSDNQNYTFSYKNTTEDYDGFFKDVNALSKELVANNYEVLSINRKNVANHLFIVGELRINGRVKYLYLTQVNQDYTSVGVIDAYEGGMWDLALNAIAEINDSIQIDGVYTDTYSNNSYDPYYDSTYESSSYSSSTTNDYENEQSNDTSNNFNYNSNYSQNTQSQQNTQNQQIPNSPLQ